MPVVPWNTQSMPHLTRKRKSPVMGVRACWGPTACVGVFHPVKETSMHAPPSTPQASQPHRLLTAVALAHHLGGTHNGAGWRAPCPAHADPGQALALIESKDQHGFPCTLLTCQANCTIEA